MLKKNSPEDNQYDRKHLQAEFRETSQSVEP